MQHRASRSHRVPGPAHGLFHDPPYIDFRGEIPKTPTGKMEKYKLRNEGVTPTTWDRVAAGVKLTR